MFDPDLRVSDIKYIVLTVIRQNAKTISNNLKYGKGSNITAKVYGGKYKVSINSDGHVSSAFPVK